jgi:hypothetical protein
MYFAILDVNQIILLIIYPGILKFTATAVLGSDAFDDLSFGEMEDRLKEKYTAFCKSPLAQYNPISMAMSWAWPPTIAYHHLVLCSRSVESKSYLARQDRVQAEIPAALSRFHSLRQKS